jgi:hypothetical protein
LTISIDHEAQTFVGRHIPVTCTKASAALQIVAIQDSPTTGTSTLKTEAKHFDRQQFPVASTGGVVACCVSRHWDIDVRAQST